jgi:hypothetical protein
MTHSCGVGGDGDVLGVGVGVELVDELVLGVSVGVEVWSGPSATEELLDDVEESGVVVSDGDVGASVGVVVSVADVLGESPGAEESPTDATAPVLRAVPPPVPEPVLFDEVRTVEVVGGEPQPAESATAACAAKAVTSSTTIPKKASATAAPNAAGLRISALTVNPRFT